MPLGDGFLRGRRVAGHIPPLVLASAVLVAIVGFLLPQIALDPFEINPDEGLNVMKGMLVMSGYPLYEEIWSDQPPLFTHGLAIAFRLFGPDVSVARALVLAFSCTLVLGAWHYLRILGGTTYAFIGCLSVALTPKFLILSISAMVGLPALAMAIVSLALLAHWHRHQSDVWLMLSAMALSLSVLIKLFTAVLVPVFGAGVLCHAICGDRHEGWSSRLRPAVVWGLTFSVSAAVLLVVLVGVDELPQLTSPHLAAQAIKQYQTLDVDKGLKGTGPLMFLAALGGVVMISQRRWLALYPVAWLGLGYLLLRQHAPVWWHQQLLVTIPAALLAACAVGEMVRWSVGLWRRSPAAEADGAALRPINDKKLQDRVRRFLHAHGLARIALMSLIAAGVVAFLRNATVIPDDFSRLRKNLGRADRGIVAEMARLAPLTRWVVTDRPMFAFRAGLPVPPSLAVMSEKRLLTSHLSEQAMLETIRETKPEQVLIARFRWPPQVVNHLRDSYRVIYSKGRKTHFVRKDLAAAGVRRERSPMQNTVETPQ